MKDNINASKGVLEGLMLNSKIPKNENSKEVKKEDSEELIKRSYSIKSSTVRKLQELKVFVYPDPNITYNEIVDEAINLLYENKKIKE